MITISLRGNRESMAAIRAKGPEASRRLAQIVGEAALRVEGTAMTLAPVDTGNLRASIRAELAGVLRDMAARVVAGASYSAFVEFGTRRSPSQPYLVPAIEAVAPWFFAEVKALARTVSRW